MCVYQKCPEELADCTSDAECYLARECVGACSSPDCMTACRNAHPSALVLFDALSACSKVNCLTSCG
jgi:hypothetical protein